MNVSNIMTGYTMLNAIKPKYYQTEYPYKQDIIFTKKVIKILVKNQNDKKPKHGGEEAFIYIYY